MKTWEQVTNEDVYKLREKATEGRLAIAIDRLELKMIEILETPQQKNPNDLFAKIQTWREILNERYEELFKARMEEMERPTKCPLKPAPEYMQLPLTKKQKREIEKRKREQHKNK